MTETTNTKQTQLLKAAKTLFWKYGIKRVSVEEISKEAGVSKVTFYRYFSNKAEIAKVILEQIIDEGILAQKELYKSDLSFADKIKQVVALELENSKEISEEFILDIYKRKELGLLELMEEKQQKGIQFFIDFITKGQEQGDVNKDLTPEMIVYYLDKLTKMVSDEKFLHFHKSPQDAIMTATNFFFYGIGLK